VPALTRNALVRLLAERSWTDVELATRAGLDRAYVNQVKNGRALPTVATALALARALGLPVAAVFPPGSCDPRLRLGSGRKAGVRLAGECGGRAAAGKAGAASVPERGR
jgi:transcriptional regulator with XRE-family HTH domain